jgi:ferredoxin
MPKIIFTQSQLTIDVPAGCELLHAKELYPEIPLKFGCKRGQCGVCAIKIAPEDLPHLTQASPEEKTVLTQKGHGPNYRLACQCCLNGSIHIES